MGQPSSPTIYQQPSQQEQAATKASNQEKAAALAKLNQSIFAESRGLRGMGGLYEWAGPTPDLAPGMTAANMWKKPQPEDEPPWQEEGLYPKGYKPGTQAGTWQGWNAGHGPPGDRSQPGPADYIYKYSRSGPQGDKTGPGWELAPSGRGPRDSRDPTAYQPSPQQRLANWETVTKAFERQGVPSSFFGKPPTVPIQKTPTQVEQSQRDREIQAMTQAGFPKTSLPPAKVQPVPPPPQQPKVNPQIQQALGLKPPAAAAPAAPAAARPAAPEPTAPSAPSARPAVSAAPVAQTPIAPVKPLAPTAVTKPLSNILYQTTVRPSLYTATTARGPSGGGNR